MGFVFIAEFLNVSSIAFWKLALRLALPWAYGLLLVDLSSQHSSRHCVVLVMVGLYSGSSMLLLVVLLSAQSRLYYSFWPTQYFRGLRSLVNASVEWILEVVPQARFIEGLLRYARHLSLVCDCWLPSSLIRLVQALGLSFGLHWSKSLALWWMVGGHPWNEIWCIVDAVVLFMEIYALLREFLQSRRVRRLSLTCLRAFWPRVVITSVDNTLSVYIAFTALLGPDSKSLCLCSRFVLAASMPQRVGGQILF